MAVELRTLRVSAEMDASGYVAGAKAIETASKSASAANAGLGASVSQTDQKISQAGDVLARLSRQYVDGYASAQRMNSAVNALSRGLETGKITMFQAVPILDGIYKKYGQMADGAQFAAKGQHEFAAAVSDTSARLAAQAAAANAATAATTRMHSAANANVRGASSFSSANIAAQFQDVGVTAAMGMSPLQIALQQGTQLSAVFEDMRSRGESAGAGLLAAFSSIISPVSLLTIGIVGLTAAAIQYFSTGQDESKALDDALSRHEDNIRRIKDAYGEAAEGVKAYARESTNSFALMQAASAAELRMGIAAGAQSVLGSVTGLTEQDSRTGDVRHILNSEFKPFEEAIEHLRRTAAAGEPDIAGFRRMVTERWDLEPNNAALLGTASALLKTTDDSYKATLALTQAETALDQIGDTAKRNAEEIKAFADAMERLTRIAAEPMSDQALAMQELVRARNAGGDQITRMAAEQAYRDAIKRIENREAGAAVPIPTPRPNDIDRLDQEAKARNPGADFLRSQQERIESLKLEMSLIGETNAVRARAISQMQVEQQIRRQGIDVNSAEANSMRMNAAAITEYQLALDDVTKAQQDFNERTEFFAGLGMDLFDGLISGADGLADALKRIVNALADAVLQAVLLGQGPLASLFGTAPQGGASVGGLFGQIFGSGPTRSSSSFVDGAGGGFGSVLGYVNDNYAPGAVTRAPLPAVGSTSLVGNSVEVQTWNFFKSKGLADHHVAGIMGHVGAESAFRPGAVGDGGNAFGLFQWNDRGPSMKNFVGADWQKDIKGQLDFAWHELRTTERAALNKVLASSDVRGATKAFGQFERPSGYSAANPEAMHNFTGRLQGAEKALEKFGGTTGKLTDGAASAASGLNDLGGGLSKMGDALSQFPAAPSGGGGIGGWFKGLFGGGLPSFEFMSSFSPAAASYIMGGGTAGLFANGGISDKPAIFGEAGPEAAVPLPDGRRIPVDLRMGDNMNRLSLLVKHNVVNNAHVAVRTQERREPDGSLTLDTVIDNVVADKLNRRGTASSNVLQRQYGARHALKRR
jgi:hypothetical protein